MELLILAGLAGLQGHIDAIADVWPIASGTEKALKRIFPSADLAYRQGLRVIQRTLGGGTRSVLMTRVSAFLCFWKRAVDGSIAWLVPA